MAAIVSLTVDREQICAPDTVTAKAETEPPDHTVSWSVSKDGGPPVAATGDGNSLQVRGFSGSIIEIIATLDNSSKSITVTVVDLKIEIEPGPIDGAYAISDEPGMPSIVVRAIGENAAVSEVLEWKVTHGFLSGENCPTFPFGLETRFETLHPILEPQITLEFGDAIFGSFVNVRVTAVVGGCTLTAKSAVRILGTNPHRSEIQAALPHNILGAIACKESGQRQFDAPPNGGMSECPLIGDRLEVGIMQIENPTDAEVWDWRANVAKGVENFQTITSEAEAYPQTVRMSEGFRALVSDFNNRREEQGLTPISIELRDYAHGNFDNNPQELELDSIRGYDGWHGAGQFGLPLHEFRVATEVIDGEPRLRVVEIDEQSARGKAVWERVPVSARPIGIGDPAYVDAVIHLLGGCTSDITPAFSCNVRVLPDKGPPLSFHHPGNNVTAQFRAVITSPSTCPETNRIVKWEAFQLNGSSGTVAFDPQGDQTVVTCGHPNKVRLRATVHIQGAAVPHSSDFVDLSVPQFFRLDFRPEFDQDLERLGLRRRPPANGSGLTAGQAETNAQVRQAIIDRAIETAREDFNAVNVRFVLDDAIEADAIEAIVGAGNVSRVLVGGPAPPAQDKRREPFGLAPPDPGNKHADDLIRVFSGEFTDRGHETLMNPATLYEDIFDEFAVEELNGTALFGEPIDEGEFPGPVEAERELRFKYIATATMALGRFLGTVISHECGHSLGLSHVSRRSAMAFGFLLDFSDYTGIQAFDPATGEVAFTDPVRFGDPELRRLFEVLPVFEVE